MKKTFIVISADEYQLSYFLTQAYTKEEACENVKKILGQEYISDWLTQISAKEYMGGTIQISSKS